MQRFHMMFIKGNKYELRVKQVNKITKTVDIYLYEVTYNKNYKEVFEFTSHNTIFSVDLEFDEVMMTEYNNKGIEYNFELYDLITIKDLNE